MYSVIDVLNVKLVSRCVGDFLKSTLHALELSLEEPDFSLHSLLQLVLTDEQVTKSLVMTLGSAPVTTSMAGSASGLKERDCSVYV